MKVIYCHNRNSYQTNPRSIYVPRGWDSDYPSHTRIECDTEVNPRGGSTVAMESIPSWLLDTIQQGDTIVRKVGIARCSKDDNYNKKKGREIAHSRLKQVTLTVVNLVRFAGSYTVVFFEDENGNLFEVKKSGDPYCARLIRMLEDN